jgi:hypothetical protein
MKRLFQVAFLFVVLKGNAQLTPENKAPLNFFQDRNPINGASRSEAIWSEDFSADIDGTWENIAAGGVAHWEYRGPMTNPTSEIGTQGSCLIAGSNGVPINSPTRANGFVIFDSNFWDNPSLPCTEANFGSGPVPGPHYATLTSPAIDLSGHYNVALIFNQYLRMYSGAHTVQISTDNFNWYTILNFDLNTNNFSGAVNEQITIPISAYAGGQPTVRIRFVFDGLYYFWQLDDLCIAEIPENDMRILTSHYGAFDFYNPGNPTGFEWMEYSKYPVEMSPTLKFSANCMNMGSQFQNNCRLNVEVRNAATDMLLHQATSDEGFAVEPASALTLRADVFTMPPSTGEYYIAYSETQDETDFAPENNLDSLDFEITPVTYARDNGATSTLYYPNPEYAGQNFEIGNIYLITAPDLSCHSLSVALGLGSVIPSSIYASIYTFNAGDQVDATLLGTSNPIQITSEMLNDFGDEIVTTLEFNDPIPVVNGQSYFVAIGSDNGADHVIIGLSGKADAFTSWIKLGEEWFYIPYKPIVRMNFGDLVGVDNLTQEFSQLAIYPNPTETRATLNLSRLQNTPLEISISNMQGAKIYSESLPKNHGEMMDIDTSNLASGCYLIKIKSAKSLVFLKFIKS